MSKKTQYGLILTIVLMLPLVQAATDCSSVTQIPSTECKALVALYNSTNGNKWENNSGWLETNTPCDWDRVSCSDKHVSKLRLSSNQLTGSIPRELDKLTNLTRLYLSRNKLTGSIPKEIGKLTKLITLSLYSNKLTGSIPKEIGKLTKLTTLYLDSNQLTGSIPREIGKLTKLITLYLDSNQLCEDIPIELKNLSNIPLPDQYGDKLLLDNNHLTASDSELIEWLDNHNPGWETTQTPCSQKCKLQFSSASSRHAEDRGQITITVTRTNNSDGAVSVEYASSDDTATAEYDYDAVSGKLKWSDGDVSDKTFTVNIIDDAKVEDDETFTLTLKKVKGAELGTPNTAEVTIIDDDNDEPSIDCMEVTQIPTSECEALVALYKSANGTNWTANTNWNATNMPCSWYGVACSGGHVSRLSLYSNKLKGKIPAKLSDLTELRHLFLFENDLDGNIPAEIGNLSKLQYLWLDENDLCGKIPDGLMKTSIPAQEGYLQIDNNHLGTHSVSEEMEIWLNARNHGWENSQNSDGCPGTLQFTKATYSVGESDGNVTITVKRVDGNSGEVTVKCNTSDDTAMAEKDYTETTNTLKWKDGNNAGKDCEIEIIDDDKHEEKETFIISLGEPKNGADLGTPDTAVVTINDND